MGVLPDGAVEHIHSLAGIIAHTVLRVVPVIQNQAGILGDFRQVIIQGVQTFAGMGRKRKGISQCGVKIPTLEYLWSH